MQITAKGRNGFVSAAPCSELLLSCYEECVAIILMIALEESCLMALVGNQLCRCSIVGIAFQKQTLSLTLRLIEALCPAFVRKAHGLYILITGRAQLLYLIGNGVYLGIGIMPEQADLVGTLIGKPNSITDNKPAMGLKELTPQFYAMAETYIIYGSLAPYHVYGGRSKWQITHVAYYSLNTVAHTSIGASPGQLVYK